MSSLLDRSPEHFAEQLVVRGKRRAWIAWPPGADAPIASERWLDPLANALARELSDYDRHEAIFFEVGPETGVLYAAFLHRTLRGQGQGGLRNWPYSTFEAFLRDGLRLARGMGRKNALAGLWWGGGKGVIARPPNEEEWSDPGWRRILYREFGRFTTSLRGSYITAEDAGTMPGDMQTLHEATRFATCVPEAVGGSGNPAPMTAAGVIRAIEAALEFQGRGTLEGKRIAMQGAGNVSAYMIGELFERGVERIVASEISADSRSVLLDAYSDRPLEIRLVELGDESILAERCDVLVPNALGGVLRAKTIPQLRTELVCGAANNIVEDDDRDGAALEARGITFVPDYIANRMGIVTCCDEQAGHLEPDPAFENQLGREHPDSIYRVVLRVLERARSQSTTPVAAANELADDAMTLAHPIHGDRCQRIVASLLREQWENEAD